VDSSEAPPTEAMRLVRLSTTREDGQVMLHFSTRFGLPPKVLDALHKGIPLHFTAQVRITRPRWYWKDELVLDTERTWRLSWQPLTQKYRVSMGGLTQSHTQLTEALSAVRSAVRWSLLPTSELPADEPHQLFFDYRLDTRLLPRPMQIGVVGQSEWSLQVSRQQDLN
jgi:hypothetical protein